MLEFAYSNLGEVDENKLETLDYYLLTLRNEIGLQMSMHHQDKTKLTESLFRERFDKSTYLDAREFLQTLKRLHVARQTDARKSKESLTRQLTSSPKKAAIYHYMKDAYTNDKLTSLVYDNMDKTRILEHSGRLIQKIYPIYTVPDPAHIFDFHAIFYAPQKHFLGYHIETLYFNICMIWFMIVVLVVTLYYDLLRKIVTIRPRFIIRPN